MNNDVQSTIRQALEGSLLSEAVRLFALIASTDLTVSAVEKKYVKDYFTSLYRPDIAEVLYQQFIQYTKKQTTVEQVTSEFTRRFRLPERIFLLMKTYELISADKVLQNELEITREIAHKFEISSADIHVLENLYGLAEHHPETLTGGVINILSISGSPANGDIFARHLAGEAHVIKVVDNFYVFVPWGGSLAIVGTEVAPYKTSVPIRYPNSVFIERLLLHYTDIEAYFNQAHVAATDCTLYLCEEEQEFVVRRNITESAVLAFDFQKLHIFARVLREDVQIHIAERKLQSGEPLALNDMLVYKGTEISVRKIFYDHRYGRNTFTLATGVEEFTIGNDNSNDIYCYDATRKKWTFRVRKKNDAYILDCSNAPFPVYVQKQKIVRERKLADGDTILFEHHALTFDFTANVCYSSTISFRRFVAQQLEYVFTDGSNGLRNVSFDVEGGELVAILGPSGCGKSTLLNLLNGNYSPHTGFVQINDSNLHDEFARIRDYLGYVPQDDLLLEHLTVYENLYYNAKLRFPGKSDEELNESVERVLRDIDLMDKRNMKVGSPLQKTLSGGQRKRLNIGLELLSDAEVFLLDEPTSGLSSKDSERIVELLDRIALRGKMVFVVIHQPSVKLYNTFRKVLLLDKGGFLVYFGNSREALHYFHSHPRFPKTEDEINPLLEPSLLLDKIEETIQDIDGKPLPKRLYPPEYWAARFEQFKASQAPKHVFADELIPSFPPRELSTGMQIKRTLTLLKRNSLNKLRDTSNLLITFLEAPGLAFIVALLFRYTPSGMEYTLFENKHYPDFLFLSVVIMLFLALTGSVDEIIKDGSLLLRERMMNIKNRSYFFSKLTTLLAFATIQTLLYMGVSAVILDIRELFWEMSLFLLIVSYVGIGIGLFVSALPNISQKAASNLVPLLLVPQIIFGGSLIPYDDMAHLRLRSNERIPTFCHAIPSRWAFEGMLSLHHTGNSYFPESERQRKQIIHLKEKRDSLITLWGESAYEKNIESLEKTLEKFQNTNMLQYGNDRTAGLMDEKTFVSSKLWFGKSVPTPMFNGGFLLLIGIIANLGTLLLLKGRKQLVGLVVSARNIVQSFKK